MRRDPVMDVAFAYAIGYALSRLLIAAIEVYRHVRDQRKEKPRVSGDE